MSEVMLNPFDANGFTAATMTGKINKNPNKYGMIRDSGIFTIEPVYNRNIIFNMVKGKISLLKSMAPGAKPPQKDRAKAEMRLFQAVHIPQQHRIWASDIFDKLSASTNKMVTLMEIMAAELEEMKSDHAITEEHLLVGALKGIVYDADGTSVIKNLFTEFGPTKETAAFDLGNADADPKKTCKNIVRHVKKNLLGEVTSGVECICDSVFMDNLTGHPKVKEVWVEHQAMIDKIMSDKDPTEEFKFGGITFKEYDAEAPAPGTGTAVPFISKGKAHFYPAGTKNTAKLYYAPAVNFRTAGKKGESLFAQQTMDAKGTYVDIDTEQNLFPIWRRPECLVEGDDGVA